MGRGKRWRSGRGKTPGSLWWFDGGDPGEVKKSGKT